MMGPGLGVGDVQGDALLALVEIKEGGPRSRGWDRR